MTRYFLSLQAQQQQLLILMQTGKKVFLSTYSPYLLRKAAVAAVINNLVLSAALRSFQASQLAAWLNPPLSPSIIGARCRPVTLLSSDNASLSGILTTCRKSHCSLSCCSLRCSSSAPLLMLFL